MLKYEQYVNTFNNQFINPPSEKVNLNVFKIPPARENCRITQKVSLFKADFYAHFRSLRNKRARVITNSGIERKLLPVRKFRAIITVTMNFLRVYSYNF